jgi:hypothetical protein
MEKQFVCRCVDGPEVSADSTGAVLEVTEAPACSDSQHREIGERAQRNIHELLGSLALYPFTAVRGSVKNVTCRLSRPWLIKRNSMSRTDFELLVAQARIEAATPALKVRLNSW